MVNDLYCKFLVVECFFNLLIFVIYFSKCTNFIINSFGNGVIGETKEDWLPPLGRC